MSLPFVSTDKSLMDIDVIHGFLKESYWAKDVSKEKIEGRIRHSLCFGLFFENRQIGFARVVTDYTVFAYLADVFILESFQGKGYAKILLSSIFQHKELQQVRWLLGTKDAHSLYEKFGFTPVKHPERMMERAPLSHA